jgi:Asp-tRNA(Asn)/Glu-tRNA(Gln) amidotransferase B subunit
LEELADGRLPLRYAGTAEDIKKKLEREREREKLERERQRDMIKSTKRWGSKSEGTKIKDAN